LSSERASLERLLPLFRRYELEPSKSWSWSAQLSLAATTSRPQSGINGAPTKYQTAKVPDHYFYADIVESAGKQLSSGREQSHRQKLIGVLTNSSSVAIDFLADKIGST